jgi:hypothetical protein
LGRLSYILFHSIAGWSSLVARRAHNPKVTGSNPVPATNNNKGLADLANPIFHVLIPHCGGSFKYSSGHLTRWRFFISVSGSGF